MGKILNIRAVKNAGETPHPKSAGGEDGAFGPSDAALVLGAVRSARAVLRTVLLAVKAQHDRSVEYDHNETDRWNAAIGVAADKLRQVRDALIGTAGAPCLNWVTPLVLVEALEAALWYSAGFARDDSLDVNEHMSVLDVAIEAVDGLLSDCGEQGL